MEKRDKPEDDVLPDVKTTPAALDILLEQVGNCSRFQVVFVLLGYSPLLPAVWSLLMMTFGIYDPGWTCTVGLRLSSNDSTSSPSISTSLPLPQTRAPSFTQVDNSENVSSASTSQGGGTILGSHLTSSCDFLEACQNQNFSFEGSDSTIVTEWALVCERAWIPRVIISIQMVGLFIGSYIGGQIGDRLGRKVNLFCNLALLCITNVIAVFSISWHMFAALRFFIGMGTGGILCTAFVFSAEFISPRARGFIGTFPFWNISTGTFALTVMALKNWRHLHIATAVISGVMLLSACWVPESMRFLAVHGKLSKANKVVRKIARLNKRPVPDTTILDTVANQEIEKSKKGAKYTYLDLFRSSVRRLTIVMGMTWMVLSVCHYTIGFGIKSLSGNFYVNLLLFSIVAIPARLLATVFVTTIGRKFATILFMVLGSLGCFSVVAVQFLASDDNRGVSTTVLALGANMLLEASWGTAVVLNVELAPTAVRNLNYGFVNAAARLGGIIAPYLIPKDGFPLYASFLIMGALLTINVAALMTLAETKGRPLRDNLHEKLVSAADETTVNVQVTVNDRENLKSQPV